MDDGYADVADTIWPRLADRGWPATLFVTTGLVGASFLDRRMLSRDQLVDLAADGLALGAHGHRHLALDAVDRAVARDEIHRSRDLLAGWTGRPVSHLRLPPRPPRPGHPPTGRRRRVPRARAR